MSIARDLVAIVRRQDNVVPNLFDRLGQFASDPSRLFLEFSGLIGEVLRAASIDKPAALRAIQPGVALSPLLLDAFLCAVDEFNAAGGPRVTGLHTFLNEELPRLDWSRLSTSRLLTPEVVFPKGPLDFCIWEILFANCDVSELAAAGHCDCEAPDFYSLLTEAARGRFADANLLRHRNFPLRLFERLRGSSDLFLHAVFRRRDGAEPLSPAPEDAAAFAAEVEAIAPRIPPPCLFSFFVCAVFPVAPLVSRPFLIALLALPEFPSDDPAFPVDAFLASDACVDSMSFKIFFDIFTRAPDEALMERLFDRLIQAGGDGTDFLAALFRSGADAVEPFRSLFLSFARLTIALSADVLYTAAERYLALHARSVAAFYATAVAEDTRRELFLTPDILWLFWDYAFIQPPASLVFLVAVAEYGGTEESAVEFWEAPTVFPCMFDAIAMGRDGASHFLDFVIEIARKGPEWLVRRLGREVEDFPCQAVFRRVCAERFGAEE
jgi:hypothetical protein